MNAIVARPLHGEVLAPGDLVWVYGTPHPLNAVASARIACQLPAGLSVAEILNAALAGKPSIRRSDLIVHIGDRPVPAAWWARVRVKPGAIVTFTPRLAGGDTGKA